MKKRKMMKVSEEFSDFTRNLKGTLERDTGKRVSLVDTTEFIVKELKKKK